MSLDICKIKGRNKSLKKNRNNRQNGTMTQKGNPECYTV